VLINELEVAAGRISKSSARPSGYTGLVTARGCSIVVGYAGMLTEALSRVSRPVLI